MVSRGDPYGNYKFIVETAGIRAAGFAEDTGLTTEIDVIECRSSNEDVAVHKLPDLKKYTDIKLKRRLNRSTGLWGWRACWSPDDSIGRAR